MRSGAHHGYRATRRNGRDLCAPRSGDESCPRRVASEDVVAVAPAARSGGRSTVTVLPAIAIVVEPGVHGAERRRIRAGPDRPGIAGDTAQVRIGVVVEACLDGAAVGVHEVRNRRFAPARALEVRPDEHLFDAGERRPVAREGQWGEVLLSGPNAIHVIYADGIPRALAEDTVGRGVARGDDRLGLTRGKRARGKCSRAAVVRAPVVVFGLQLVGVRRVRCELTDGDRHGLRRRDPRTED